ncbi:MAG: hypothetical protein V1875_06200 [Candidatus Altiarchaeota archaeon]
MVEREANLGSNPSVPPVKVADASLGPELKALKTALSRAGMRDVPLPKAALPADKVPSEEDWKKVRAAGVDCGVSTEPNNVGKPAKIQVVNPDEPTFGGFPLEIGQVHETANSWLP